MSLNIFREGEKNWKLALPASEPGGSPGAVKRSMIVAGSLVHSILSARSPIHLENAAKLRLHPFSKWRFQRSRKAPCLDALISKVTMVEPFDLVLKKQKATPTILRDHCFQPKKRYRNTKQRPPENQKGPAKNRQKLTELHSDPDDP